MAIPDGVLNPAGNVNKKRFCQGIGRLADMKTLKNSGAKSAEEISGSGICISIKEMPGYLFFLPRSNRLAPLTDSPLSSTLIPI